MEAKTKFSVYRWDIILPTGMYAVYGSYFAFDGRCIVIYVNPTSVDTVAVIPDNALVMRGEKVHDLNFDE